MNKQRIYNDINESLGTFHRWAKRGLIVGQIKEKYLTTRWYAYLGSDFSLNDIFYPGHVYYRLPNFCRYIDDYLLTPLFGRLVLKWRVYCYKQAYKEVLINFPNIDHCIDYPDLLDKKLYENYIKNCKAHKY